MAGVSGPLVAIVGETASGKSALALALAERFDGEIICADSRTVYRGMDIGTAKPTSAERSLVRHHCLDLVAADEPFTVADFKRHADKAISDILHRGKLPLLVGGSGLYIDAVLYDFTFRSPSDPKERARLSLMTIKELQNELQQKRIPLPENRQNPRHLVRALEAGGMTAERNPLRPHTLIIGVQQDRASLEERIRHRVSGMVEQGFIEEVRRLGEQYGWNVPALQAPGYTAFREYIDGRLSLDEAKALFMKNDLNLAKRQRTWYRRNNSIHWLENRDNLTDSVDLITTILNK